MQCISQPTHIKGNILDLILTNSADIVSNVSVLRLPWSTSDHYSISFSLLVGPSSRFCSSSTSFLNYSQVDYRSMCDFLLDWDFSVCFLSLDVEFIWSEIKSAILEVINRFVPTATIPKRHYHLPGWFDGSLCHNLKRVRTFRRKCISHPTPTPLQNLACLESDLKDNIAIAESTYVSTL